MHSWPELQLGIRGGRTGVDAPAVGQLADRATTEHADEHADADEREVAMPRGRLGLRGLGLHSGTWFRLSLGGHVPRGSWHVAAMALTIFLFLIHHDPHRACRNEPRAAPSLNVKSYSISKFSIRFTPRRLYSTGGASTSGAT